MQLAGGTVVLDTTEDIRKSLKQVREELKLMKSTDPGFVKQSKDLLALEGVAKSFRLEINKLGAGGYYRQLSAQLEQLRDDYKNLTEAELKAAKGKELEQKIGRISNELTDIDKRIGLYQRNIGNYRKGLGELADLLTFGIATGGFITAIQLVAQAMSTAFENTVKFSRQLSTISAVSGATAEDMAKVREEILRVGANSEFTTQEIAQLAIEYAKLGFTATEINDVLSATTDVATLAGEDLAQTASLVGSVLNIFAIETSRAAAVGDILAGVFNRTALDLKKFETGISIVGPAAAAVGVDLQTTAGLLGILADNSIDASTAGTSLRNIFIETANSGKSLGEAFDTILASENKLSTANAIFGKDASVVALTLAEQRGEVEKLIAELYNVEGASKAAADKMRLDLKGSVDQLQGATETLGITLGLLVEKPLSAMIRAVADLVGGFASWIQYLGPAEQLLASIGSTITKLLPFLGALTLAITIQNRQLIVAAISAIPNYIAALLKSNAALRLAAFAQTLLNIAMNANPIGIVITAIGALISGLLLAANGTSNFSKGIRGVTAVVLELAKTIGQFITNPIEFFKNIGNLGKNLGKAFKAGFESENFSQTIESVGNNYTTIAGRTEAEHTEIVRRESEKRQAIREDEIRKAATLQAEEARRQREATAAYLKANEANLKSLGLGSVTGQGESFMDKIFKVDLTKLQRGTAAATDIINKALGKPGTNITQDKFDLDRTRRKSNRTFSAFDYTDSAAQGLEKMRAELSRLEGEIQDNILAGKPYAEQLKNYFTLTDQVTKAEKEWKALLDARASSLGEVSTSIETYTKLVKRLQEELNKADSDKVGQIIPDLTKAQQQLTEAENAIKRLQRAAANADFTAVLETDLEPDNNVVEQQRQLAIRSANERIKVEKELQIELKAINLTADIQLLENRKRLFQEGSDEYLKIENDLAAKRADLGALDPNAIRRESEARINANKRIIGIKTRDEELYNAQRIVIELALEAFLIQEKLKNFKGSLEEEQELTIQHLDTIAQLQEAHENERKARRSSNGFSEETIAELEEVNMWLDVAKESATAISDYIGSVFERQRLESDAYYDRQIEKARGNKEEITRLEEEKAKKNEELRKKEFEQRKKYEIAAAAIAYAQGIINILIAPSSLVQPFDAIYRAIRIGALSLEYKTQVNNIRNKGFAGGGYTGKGEGKADSSGHRPVGVVHEDEYVMPKRVLMTPEGSALARAAERLRLGDRAPYRAYATGGFVLPAGGTPSSYSDRGTTSVALFTTDQIELMANIIADRLQTAAHDGIVDGIEDAVTAQERLARLKLITG